MRVVVKKGLSIFICVFLCSTNTLFGMVITKMILLERTQRNNIHNRGLQAPPNTSVGVREQKEQDECLYDVSCEEIQFSISPELSYEDEKRSMRIQREKFLLITRPQERKKQLEALARYSESSSITVKDVATLQKKNSVPSLCLEQLHENSLPSVILENYSGKYRPKAPRAEFLSKDSEEQESDVS